MYLSHSQNRICHIPSRCIKERPAQIFDRSTTTTSWRSTVDARIYEKCYAKKTSRMERRKVKFEFYAVLLLHIFFIRYWVDQPYFIRIRFRWRVRLGWIRIDAIFFSCKSCSGPLNVLGFVFGFRIGFWLFPVDSIFQKNVQHFSS